MLKTKPSILAIALASILVGCGGSGDDSPNTSTPNVETPETGTPDTGNPSPQATLLQAVSGTLTTPDYQAIPNADVSISIVDKAGTPLFLQSSTTDSDGVFEAQLPTFENASSATSVIVSYNKAGFTSGERLFAIDESSVAIAADAIISPVVVQSFKKQDLQIVASSSDKQSVTFSLVKDGDGRKAIRAGTPLAMSETESDLKIDLPIEAIGDDVEALTVEMAHFDSADITDIQSFPGDFVGYGETENQGVGTNFSVDNSQEDPYRLISTTFAQISITDQNGDLLPISERLAASGDTPTVQAYVSPEAYRTITEDVALDIAGIQVPIYIYRYSKWEFVGNGTLTDSLGDPLDGQLTGTLPDYLASLPDSVYVSIPVTSANEWVQWINLDWPVFAEPTQTCVTGKLSYERGEAYTRDVALTLPDGGTQWLYADNNGNVSASFQAIEGDSANYNVYAYNYFTRAGENYQPNVSTTGECDVNIDVSHELMNPFQCSITGSIVEPDGTTPIANTWIQTRSAGTRLYAVSDKNGEFSLSSNCEGNVTLSLLDQVETITLPEGLQPGDVYNGITIVRENSAPRISAWKSSSNSLRVSDEGKFSYYISDGDGDDFTYQITCTNACSITDNGGEYSTVRFAAEGKHTVTITAEDEYGKAASKALVFDVKPNGNVAPEIVGFDVNGQRYAPGNALNVVEGVDLAIDVVAIDMQGDSINYAWENLPQGNCAEARCEYPSVAAGNIELSVTATDDNATPKSSEANLIISVNPNQAPEVLVSPSSTEVLTANGFTQEEWRIRAIVRDDQDPSPTLTWAFVNSSEAESEAFTILDSHQAALVEGMSIETGEYTVTVTATDNLGETTQVQTVLVVTEDEPPVVELLASDLVVEMTDKGEGAKDITFEATFSDDRTSEDSLEVSWSATNNLPLEISEDAQTAILRKESLIAGVTDITISVTDALGQTTSKTVTIDVIVTEDVAPEVSLSASHSVVDIAEYGQGAHDVVFTAQFSDDMTPTADLTVNWTTDNGVPLVISADKTQATIVEGSLVAGETNVIITVTDGYDQSTVKQQSLTVNVADDAAPEVTVSSSHATVEMVENGQGAHDVVFTATYSDDFTPTADLVVTWSASNGAVLAVSSDKQTATLKAGDLTAGNTTVRVTVADQYGQSTSASQVLVVSISDDENPTISVSASHTHVSMSEEGGGSTDVVFTASVSDDYTEASELSINWTVSNAAALRVSEDGLTATLLGTSLTEGTIVVTATVSDEMGQSSSDSQSLTVDIDNRPVITAMSVSPSEQKVLAGEKNGQPITITVAASDDKTDLLSFGWTSNTGITITDMDNTVVFPAGSLGVGTYSVTAYIADELGQEVSQTVNFSITEQDGNIDIEIE
ncbi:hypothetical protein G5S52_21705 [Grimontia sp. S25]|uniref:PKD domain-containing protein n=1 Tax=Grimontia sedimenti TaxID=2711294 RepID=A0A6M1RJ11_9GAMM|nr:hypothetical protein [Grimontia sedimenti]NGO00145.1 hypothetical protein [Grimontia sedimenti]